MSAIAMKTRQWIVVGTMLATMLAADLAFGEAPTHCKEMYLQSGLTQQQMTFEEFHELYAGSVCAPQ